MEQTAEQKQVAKQQFEKLTEAASTLMDSGELDVYSQKKVSIPMFSYEFTPWQSLSPP